MDFGALAAVVASLGVGGIAGGWIRAEHERTERFRERMIDVAQEFLRHTADARSGLTNVSRSISDADSAGPAAETVVGAALKEADAAIQAADGVIPTLSVIFPPGSGVTSDVWERAAWVVVDLKRALALLNDTLEWTDERRATMEDIRQSLVIRQGEFAGAANREIWRRWFFRRPFQRRQRGSLTVGN